MTVNFETGIWLNEPMTWSRDGNRVSLVTDAKTDFWRNTYYGFVRDSGHFLGYEAGSSFTATVRVTGKFESLYDQAGLMIRIDDTRWVKTGVELTDRECATRRSGCGQAASSFPQLRSSRRHS